MDQGLASDKGKPTVHLSGVSKIYDMGEVQVRALSEVTMDVPKGQMIVILGPSGSGKTTLRDILGCLDGPSTGILNVLGQDVSRVAEKHLSRIRRKNIGFVFQDFFLIPTLTALENVAMPLMLRSEDTSIAKKKAADMLSKVGLKDRVRHKPGELSGGERQRAAIARALVTNPKCVLADEPTGNLDGKTANKVYEMMLELNKEFETSFIVVTHDEGLARNMDRVFRIESGHLIAEN